MSLPEIPDEAVAAAVNRAGTKRKLEAAWPHLYAAALRHAADGVLAVPDPGDDIAVVNGSYTRGWLTAIATLRRLADEATP